MTVRWQVGGGVLYLYDTLWKAHLTLVQQRLLDRAKNHQGLNGTQPHSMHPYGCKSDVSQRDTKVRELDKQQAVFDYGLNSVMTIQKQASTRSTVIVYSS